MLPLRYLTALALTLAIELPLYTVVLARGFRLPPGRAIVAALGVNLCSHPPLWWSLRPWAGSPAYGALLLLGELAVCAVEALLLAWWLRRRDRLLLALSVAVNGASVLVGLMLAAATAGTV
jgi:hypothetical protein